MTATQQRNRRGACIPRSDYLIGISVMAGNVPCHDRAFLLYFTMTAPWRLPGDITSARLAPHLQFSSPTRAHARAGELPTTFHHQPCRRQREDCTIPQWSSSVDHVRCWLLGCGPRSGIHDGEGLSNHGCVDDGIVAPRRGISNSAF